MCQHVTSHANTFSRRGVLHEGQIGKRHGVPYFRVRTEKTDDSNISKKN